jgi:hypothetical protein
MIATADDFRPFPAPALLEAGDDDALTPRAVRLLLWCYQQAAAAQRCAVDAGRPYSGVVRVKAVGVFAAIRFRRQDVPGLLDLLIQRGYLADEGRDGLVRLVRVIPERRNGDHG